MLKITPCSIVFYYTGIGKYAINALAGALVDAPATRDIPLLFPNNFERLNQAIFQERSKQRRIIVCWSFFSTNFVQMKKKLKLIKHRYSDQGIIHVAGGVHATAEPMATLDAGFDFVACGEGEQIIVNLASAFKNDKSLKNIRGLNFLENKLLSRNGRSKPIDLNSYPPAAADYKKFGVIEITRGCIYACKFCQTPFIYKARFRHRNIENIKHHVSIMHSKGLRDYRFLTPSSLSYGSKNQDVDLTAIETMLAEVRSIIGSDKRIFYGTFPSEVRPEHISPKALAVLKKYVHNDNLIIGAQSGSQRMLDLTHRGHSVDVIEQAVRYCVENHFKPKVDFIFGMPGETGADARLSRELMRKLTGMGALIHSHTFIPLPGTPYQNKDAPLTDSTTQHYIKKLTAQGKAFGKWKSQMEIAQHMKQLKFDS